MLIQKYWRVILSLIICLGGFLLFLVFGYDTLLDYSPQVESILHHGSGQEKDFVQDEQELIDPDLLAQDSFLGADELQEIDSSDLDISMIKNGIGNPSIEQLLPLYYKNRTPQVLSLLVEKAIQSYDYTFALQVLSNEGLQDAIDVVGIHTYIYILFNEQELDYGRITRLKEILTILYEREFLTFDEFEFYKGLIALSRGDTDNWFYFMDELPSSDFFDVWSIPSYESRESYNSYQDVPPFYMIGLLGSIAYRQQYMRISQKLGTDMVATGVQYILAHQLVAYSSLLLSDNTQAQQSLTRLIENDKTHDQRYTYLLGIALYNQGDYTQAVFHFSAIRDQELYDKAQQYLFLIYQKLKDTKRLAQLMSEIISTGIMSPNLYISFFEELFWTNADSTVYYLDTMTVEIDEMMGLCYAQQKEKEICMYGKAGLFYQLGDYKKSYQYLSRVVLVVYNSRIFDRLADISLRLGDENLAKKRYIRGMKVASTSEDELDLRNKLKTIMNK